MRVVRTILGALSSMPTPHPCSIVGGRSTAAITLISEALEMAAVLITGGAGFIGSHLAEKLLSEGHIVRIIDDLSTGRLINIEHLLTNTQFHFARADITNELVLDRLASQSDVIVHLAAAVGVKQIVERPVHTIETNIIGTEAVLRTALRYGCRVLLASTSEVYGKSARLPFAEQDDVVLGPTVKSRWAYAASKMVDEFLGLAYHRECGLEVVVFRLFNTIGPRQRGHYGMVVPRLMRQALQNKPLTIYGDGSQQRCFCDITDVVEAVLLLMNHSSANGGVYNIGNPNEEVSILQLGQRVLEITHSSSDLAFVPYAEAYAPGFEDMQRRVPDISRIQSLTGWTPKTSLEASLVGIRQSLKKLSHLRLPQSPTSSISGVMSAHAPAL